MKFIIAATFLIAASCKRLALDRYLDGNADRKGTGLEMAYMHPEDRWAENKIDVIFPGNFNTIPRGESEWVSSGPQAFHVESAIPSVSY